MKLKGILFFVLGASILISCYRSPNDSVFEEDLDMIFTNYQPDVDYKTEYLTYAISDSFSLASNVDDIDVDYVNDPVFRSNIKNAIRNNMDAYGYQLSKDTLDTPDVFIPVTIAYINTKGVSYTPIYMPGWGYGWGYPGYGWGGGYYYWSWIPTTFSYDQGSVIIDMYDLKNAKEPIAPDTIWDLQNVWNLNISGLIQSTTESERNEKISVAIDQGFEQSPYLNKNN